MAKVDTKRLFELLKEDKTQKECAQILGVSEGTVSKHVNKTKTAINRGIALFSAGGVLDEQINYLRDLAKLKSQTTDLLDMIYSIINEEDEKIYWAARARLQRLTGHKGNLQSLMTSLHAELRKQLQFGFDIDKVVNDLENIKRIQQVILETIQRTDIETARKIVAELARLKIIKSTLDFDIHQDTKSIE